MIGAFSTRPKRISMYKCPICGKGFKKQGNHPQTHLPDGFIPWNIDGGYYSPELRAKMSISQKERFTRMPTPNKGIPHTEETKMKISILRSVPNPKLRERFKNPLFKKRWIQRRRNCHNTKPSSLEKEFIALCDKYGLPFQYVGDGEVIIGGKNPDFLNINGKKQVVEIFSRVFHDPDKTFRREIPYHQTYGGTKAHYEQYGFDCVIIWDEEFEDENLILDRLGVI